MQGLGAKVSREERVVVAPAGDGQDRDEPGPRLGGHRVKLGQALIGGSGIEGKHAAETGDDEDVARLVEGKHDRFDRRVAQHREIAGSGGVAVDAMEALIDEVNPAGGVGDGALDVVEAAGEPGDGRVRGTDRGEGKRSRRLRRIPRKVEAGQFAGHHPRVVIDDLEGGVEVELAGAVEVDTAEGEVAGSLHPHGVGERGLRADDAVEVEVGEEEVLAVLDQQREGVGSLSVFLLHLEGVELPIGGAADDDLMADVVLARHGVNLAGGRRVGDIQPGHGIGVGSPDALEDAAAAVGHPNAVGL